MFVEKVLTCEGCGAPLQSEDPSRAGYLPESALAGGKRICQRCFRLKHYNENTDVPLDDGRFLKMLHEIGQKKALFVKIVDIFDFNGSWLPGIHRFAGRNPVLLIGNKADLLPKSVNKDRVVQWMRSEAKHLGLKPVDILLISAEKGYRIREAIEMIDYYRNGGDVYVIGCTNVGKSTFINRLVKEIRDEDTGITTSFYPGTTLNIIEVPLEDGKTLYDTPGIINHHQMAHYVGKRDLKIITPKKEIKPKIYQLNDGQTLFFGGLARLDFLKGERTPFTCYLSNDLLVHRTKLERADELYENQRGKLLSPPGEEDLDRFPPFYRQEFSIKREKTDIVFSGLGWVTVNRPNVVVAAYAPKGVHVFIRKSII
ncbi:MAG: ribosome biogenesis GTPase YqeH [Caldibacillus debilis]|nr:ribosome biogenesis GTPase YqeH [Caldibacillus debilis]REJ28227.1 MAG: ribosome biogenesis GTPase YqeH [Caldibacillus debilis]